MSHDPRIERERQSALDALLDRSGASGEAGTLAMLAITTMVSSYPTTPGSYYAVQPVEADGPEIENGAPQFTVDGNRTFLAYNSGTAVPPSGTYVIICMCGGRWGFRFDG